MADGTRAIPRNAMETVAVEYPEASATVRRLARAAPGTPDFRVDREWEEDLIPHIQNNLTRFVNT